MSDNFQVFEKLISNRAKASMFLFTKLPSAYFAGVRIKKIIRTECVVTIPYKWFSRNPFGSTYFACLSMAAEMSTGALSMGYIFKRNPSISMLVVKMESAYFAKAKGITTFVCNDGDAIASTIDKAIATGEAQTITAKSTGTGEAGELVAEMFVTWSFKVRSRS